MYICTTKQCNVIPGLKKIENKTIDMSIYKTEFRETILFEINSAWRAITKRC